MSREEMYEKMVAVGFDEYWLGDMARAIEDGGDYDEICQFATDKVAEFFGVENPDPEYCEWDGTDYGLINQIINEEISEMLREWAEQDEREYQYEMEFIEMFKDGQIWKHDIESANEMIIKYIEFINDNEDVVAEEILDFIHNSDRPLTEWDGEAIVELVANEIFSR